MTAVRLPALLTAPRARAILRESQIDARLPRLGERLLLVVRTADGDQHGVVERSVLPTRTPRYLFRPIGGAL